MVKGIFYNNINASPQKSNKRRKNCQLKETSMMYLSASKAKENRKINLVRHPRGKRTPRLNQKERKERAE
jgi:hypothetical protein